VRTLGTPPTQENLKGHRANRIHKIVGHLPKMKTAASMAAQVLG